MLPTPEGFRRTPFGLVPVGKDFSVPVELPDGTEAIVTATVILTAGDRLIEDYRATLVTGEPVEDFDETAFPYLDDDLAYKAQCYWQDRA